MISRVSLVAAALFATSAPLPAQTQKAIARETAILPRSALARQHFGNDAPWFESRIPFFSCSDPEISRIYYYRWKLFKSHLKDLGERGVIVTEFLDDVSWSLKPFESLNDATGFHIGEGRWLRDSQPIDDYIAFMMSGGNDRHFSEAITDATYQRALVSGDRAFVAAQLPAMKRIYGAWNDHFDAARGLYFIEPLLDATEYTISSIDASGGKDGFRGGDAFRPSINSFMFANARAISRIAAEQGDLATAAEYSAKAAALWQAMQTHLWNEEMGHFIDRYKVNNAFVKDWDFIRGRELAGYTPWYFGVPDQNAKYSTSWAHLLSPDKLGGPFGIRTLEPSYEHYMKQFRYEKVAGVNRPECQWNGPSWPFQTTLALGGMANLLQNYPPGDVRREDYLRLLRQYTRQHFLKGEPNLQEDYNPDTGEVIVGLARSNHYFHSGYLDLVINGLVGIRPRADEVLEVSPLVPGSAGPDSLSYFCLENVLYHGRNLTVIFDRDGTKFGRGAGLSIYVDGRLLSGPAPLARRTVRLPARSLASLVVQPVGTPTRNLAVNMSRRGYPIPTASHLDTPVTPTAPTPRSTALDTLFQAVDGRVWFYPEVRNYWTNRGSTAPGDWFSLDFGSEKLVNAAQLFFYSDGKNFQAPLDYQIQAWKNGAWVNVSGAQPVPATPLANGENTVRFARIRTSQLRVVFANPKAAAVALVEFKALGKSVPGAATPAPFTAKTLAELLAPDARVVDAFLPGDAASETAHALAGENMQTGTFNGAKWRDAQRGGFFEFDLGVAAGQNHELQVFYWGGEATRREFEITADGQKIGAQTLQNNFPGEFFRVNYPLPATAKNKVRVRFQARPGSVAGGIFGVRVVRR